MQFYRNRFLQKHMLAGQQTLAGHRVVVRLRRGRDDVGIDLVDFEKIPVICSRGLCAGGLRNLGETVRLDFCNVQILNNRMSGTGLGAYSAAPAGADDSNIDLLHGVPS